MNIKKTLAGVASYALVGAVALGIGGTLATYTDSDSDVNTATVGGGVDIEQHEYQRENVADAINYEEFEAAKTSGETFTPDLVPFEQKQALYPAYADYEEGERSPWTALGLVDGKNILNELFYWGDYVHTGTAGNGLWDPEKLTGAMDKFVFVENTGESDCYFRTIIAFECPEGVTVGDAGAGATIGMNVNGSTIWDDDFVDYITIDDVRYKMYEFIYTDILHPKEQAHPSLLQVAFSDKMTNEEAELLGDTYEILVFSQACQVENLPTNDGVATASAEDVKSNAEIALDTAFYDVDKDHHPWVDGIKIGYEVSNDTELAAAIAAGETEIWLNAGEYNVANCGGKTLTINGSKNAVLKLYNEGEDGADYGFGAAGTGIGNITFNGVTVDTTANTGNYKGYAYMKATFNDCNFVGAYCSYSDSTFNNCTFDFKNGYFWTWGAENLTFDSCTFNGNSKTILAHGTTTTVININDCTFAATEKGYTGSGYNTAVVEIDPAGNNTYTINFTGNNTKTDSYADWYRVKDNSTGHTINGVD